MEPAEKKSVILIVDDDSFLLDMYALRFTQAGFHVETAMNADQALEKLRNGFNPVVILLDVVMPIMDGFELLETLEKEKLASTAAKIVLSNLGQQQDFDRAEKLGATGYIVKANSTPSEVVTRVNELLKSTEKQI